MTREAVIKVSPPAFGPRRSQAGSSRQQLKYYGDDEDEWVILGNNADLKKCLDILETNGSHVLKVQNFKVGTTVAKGQQTLVTNVSATVHMQNSQLVAIQPDRGPTSKIGKSHGSRRRRGSEEGGGGGPTVAEAWLAGEGKGIGGNDLANLGCLGFGGGRTRGDGRPGGGRRVGE
ncbi:protein NLP2-like [Panicum miliaceum]|uniref:Protein NLP2-like n=1 Tax=Panicum miliaceum TaxID=4540 RepID=A0A3L6Q1U9_PANMI|nr:protein NLP2-like [Panicum miliaceum]